jgi:hypothetical protein
MTFRPELALAVALLAPIAAPGTTRQTPAPPRDVNAIVKSAVQSELNANRTDHTAFIYRDHDITPDHDTLYQVVETPQGNLRRKLEDHGRPLSPEARKADDDRIRKFAADRNAQIKAQRDDSKDDAQAEELLKLLPTAYIWTFESEQGDLITLNFKPDPAFKPATMESKVLSAMAGQIVIARGDNRIRTIRGELLDDVVFGLRLFGHLKKGGTIQVERREVVPHHWQVTDSIVKIEGHALLFKSIGSVDTETRSDFKISTVETIQQACEVLTVCPPAGR